MAFTQTDIDNLSAAIAAGQGVRSLTFSDQSITFNSIAEMLALREVMQREVAGASSTSRSIRYAATSKGC